MAESSMNKSLFAGILFLIFIGATTADDLADLLQDLAIQTACLGMYSAAERGVLVTSRYDDPPDWYDPPMMANRFASMSGNMTRTTTFYGICFDYAEFAWNDIQRYQQSYNKAGMKGAQWYIAAADAGNPNTIILYDPVSKEKATTISNGVYLKEDSRHAVYAHDGAEGHAWLWVQHNNGTWYWIDPTWTDNTGYVWWGMVKNGKEVTYYPDPKYCQASNYPRPGITNTETRSSNSTYIASPSTDTSTGIGYGFGFVLAFDSENSEMFVENYGITVSLLENQFPELFFLSSLSVDYLSRTTSMYWTEGDTNNAIYHRDKVVEDSLVFGLALGYPLAPILIIYAGGGLGFTWYSGGSSGSSNFPYPEYTYNDTPPSENKSSIDLAWKVNAGLRLQYASLFAKFDVSYGTILGPSYGIGIGLFM
jgi:hypothetical protein